MKWFIILFFVFPLLLQSCMNEPISSYKQNAKGEISINLNKQNIPSNVVEIRVKMSRRGFDSILKSFNVLSDSSTSVEIDKIPAGLWHILILAFSANNTVLYSGETDIDIKPSLIIPVNIQLNPSTGGILLTITWGRSHSGSLIAFYPFNGSANDYSGNNNNGTNYGAILTTDRFGNRNNSYLFNGVNNYIYVNNSSLLNPRREISISVWIYLLQYRNYPGANNIIVKDSHSQNKRDYLLLIGGYQGTSSQVEFDVFSSDKILQVKGGNVSLQAWHHIVGTYDGKKMKLYLDGEIIDEKSYSGFINYNEIPLLIGSTNNYTTPYSNRFFNGAIDDVRIYDYSISYQEVQNLYHENGW